AGDRYFTKIPDAWRLAPNDILLAQAAAELRQYLAGKRTGFSLKLRPLGTGFQQQVWRELQNIPYGKTGSYKQIAQAIGSPNAVRAVGTAVGRNPLCILIPCHRVLTSSGAMGGYVAGTGV